MGRDITRQDQASRAPVVVRPLTAADLLRIAPAYDRDHMPRTAKTVREAAAAIESWRLLALRYREALKQISMGRVGSAGFREYARRAIDDPGRPSPLQRENPHD